MNLSFSERQSRTVATAATLLAVAVITGAVLALLFVLFWFLRTFSGVFLPLLLGALGALVFRPYYEWLRERLRLPTGLALATVFLTGLIPIVALLWVFVALLAEQLPELLSHIPDWWQRGVALFQRHWPGVSTFLNETPLGQQLREGIAAQQSKLLSGFGVVGEKAFVAGAGVLRGAGALLSWAVLPVYFGYFLTARPRPLDHGRLLPFLKPETRKDVVYLFDQFVGVLVAFFRGQLIIAFLQGLLFALGFSLVGLRYGFMIGLVLGFLNIIPYLGNTIGLGVALPLAFFQPDGGLGTLVAVLAVFVVVQLVDGYVLTPRIMGERTGLHFMVIIVAVFFWGTALGGILGMVLAIPLTAFFVSFWRLACEKYIPELV
jgi:predicted PurR-regulated permease PerM